MHVPDMLEMSESEYPERKEHGSDRRASRNPGYTPNREGQAIGAIPVRRREPATVLEQADRAACRRSPIRR